MMNKRDELCREAFKVVSEFEKTGCYFHLRGNKSVLIKVGYLGIKSVLINVGFYLYTSKFIKTI